MPRFFTTKNSAKPYSEPLFSLSSPFFTHSIGRRPIFLNTLYCIISHLVSIKLTMPCQAVAVGRRQAHVWGRFGLRRPLGQGARDLVVGGQGGASAPPSGT